ncbi:LexA family protein [Mycobacterium avium]|uniref:LexA family protein n=1 Tax=Mycobacterium avium TaxID=1764 RepID=UPI0009C13EDF|nr:hypothetical protein [Mycobacterium avium]
MAAPLTARQAEVLCYIEDYVADHGFPPSGRELAEACHLGSPSGAHRMLVVLESKGYLSRKQGLSRGLSVATPPVSASSDLAKQDFVALSALAGWQSVARDAELRMAARTPDPEAKAELIETARIRHHHVCELEAALQMPAAIQLAEDPLSLAQHELLGAVPRCDRWELFVVDELVCNRVSGDITAYASRTRPAVRGLLWRHHRLSELVLARSQRWTRAVLDSILDQEEFVQLAAAAIELGRELYRGAQTMDSWCDAGQALLSTALDPDGAAALV